VLARVHCVPFEIKSLINIQLSENAAVALQALLYTADMRDAAEHCTDWSYETLQRACLDVVIEVDSALAEANI